MLEIAEPEPAPFLLDGDAVQSELAHLRPQALREFVFFVDLGGNGRDLLAREPLGGFADRIGHFAEVEIESGSGHGYVSCSGAALAEQTRLWNPPPRLMNPCRAGI